MPTSKNNGGQSERGSDLGSADRQTNQVENNIIEVPELHFHEKYSAVDIPVVQEKIRYETKEVIQEREVHVVKPVIKEKIVEVPKYKVVEKVVEVPQVVVQEKLIEVERVEVTSRSRNQSRPISPVEKKKLDIVTQYRQVPKPVEVPIAFYSAIPVPILIDRAVPVPMELQIIQDILCPKIEAIYKDIPIPVPVKRTIEKPVPIGLYDQPELLQKYLHDPNEPLPNPVAALEHMAQQASMAAAMNQQNIMQMMQQQSGVQQEPQE
ncbi:articulin-like protein [Cryptosporidium canis]|uniref:Articulin-like protein n=1 Tax=Cryptosporidium canis TaxID=195482 RepID=A0ABQ8P422_9CRYT|nr:articulin-like protein [Cryptosporidium canis]KAJ1610529.1 articulin-like protein [Cryptosporidium canis]